MRSIRFIALPLVAALALVSCKGNPEVAKKRYVESGDKYFSKARYKEASIQYRNAIKIDGLYGLARYKLALTYLKLGPSGLMSAVKELRSAQDLLSKDQNDPKHPLLKDPPSEYRDTLVKLSDIYLGAAYKDPQFMKEVWANCQELVERDPNSFDGHRLTAYWFLRSTDADFGPKKSEEGRADLAKALGGREALDVAFEELHKADSIKPGDPELSIQLAAVFVAKGNLLAAKRDVPAAKIQYSAAEQLYRKVIDQKKDFLQAYQYLYTLLGMQNRLADAEQLLKTGYQNNPKEYGFLISLADLLRAEQRRDDMVKVLAQLKSKAGEYQKAYLDVGDFYLRVPDAESAIREYREGMAKDAKNKSAYQKRMVEVWMRQGKLPEAREVNDEILKENPKDPDALGVKAALLLDNGEVTQAIIALRDVVTHAPDNPVAHYNLGRAYFRHQDFEQARQQFQKAIDLRPDYVLSLLALAQLQWATSDFDAAFRTAQVVLTKHDQNNASAKLIQSAALMGQKKYAESRQMLDAMLKANPSSPDVLFQIGVVNLAERKYKEADDSFRRSYQLNPANTRGLMGVVETYMAQNKTDQAIQQLQEEVAKTPARAELHIALGNVGVGAGRWDMAIAQFQAVLATVPKNSRTQGEMYLRIGETQRRKGDFNAAIVSFQAARQTLPEDARVLSSLALTLDGAGDWKHAKEAYQATNKLYPNNAVVLNNLAFGIAEHAEHGEELDQALGMAQRAKQLLSTMPEVSDTLGWIYLKKNLPDNAIEIFRELVDKQPNQATFRYHLGMALSQKGDKARALQELKKALETSTSDPERKSIRDLITRLG